MNIRIDKTSRVPIYDQIEEQIKGLIDVGQLGAGDQLPTIRELLVALAVKFNRWRSPSPPGQPGHHHHRAWQGHLRGQYSRRRGDEASAPGRSCRRWWRYCCRRPNGWATPETRSAASWSRSGRGATGGRWKEMPRE